MKTDTPGGRGSLVVELATGTAIVNGTRIEMPRREFDLLAALAARPGEAFSSQELVQQVWPDDPVATDQDLRTLLYRLRKRIGDHGRNQRIVANRPAFGYLIDLSPDAVEVVKLASASEDADTRVIVLDEQDAAETEPSEVAAPTDTDQTVLEDMASEALLVRSTTSPRRAGIRVTPVVIAALVAAGLLAGSWQLGYFLSQRREAAPQAIARPPAEEPEDSTDATRPSQLDRKGSKSGSSRQAPRRSFDQSSQGSLSVDGTSSVTEDQDSADGTREGTGQGEDPREPPQPDAVLYHLFNPRSGDHFMTTRLSSAQAKEADGYDLSTEGRVFSSQVNGTVAISLDGTRAFVYRGLQSAPRNTSVTALYRLETAGDFFYTASSSAANQAQAQGWARSTAGYIAT